MIPEKIRFTADDNIAELIEVIEREGGKKIAEPKYVYRYTKSSTKLGLTLIITEKLLDSALSNKCFEIIK